MDTKHKERDFLKESFLYQNLLKKNLNKPKSQKETKDIKKKLISINKEVIDPKNNVFKEVGVTQDVSKEKAILDPFIKRLVKEKPSNIFKILGRNPYFKISYSNSIKTSQKNMPVSRRLASTASYSPEGHIIPGSTNGEYAWQVEMYELQRGLIHILLLDPLLQKLLKRRKLTKRNLEKYISSSQLVEESNMLFISKALKHFFKKDYASFLHIMVPQFENIFLKLSEDLGLDIIATDTRNKNVATRTRVLTTTTLLSKEFVETWGEDFCRRIDHVLFEPLGLKLRHKIAHGEILDKECSFENSIEVLYLYLVMLSKVKRVPKE